MVMEGWPGINIWLPLYSLSHVLTDMACYRRHMELAIKSKHIRITFQHICKWICINLNVDFDAEVFPMGVSLMAVDYEGRTFRLGRSTA